VELVSRQLGVPFVKGSVTSRDAAVSVVDLTPSLRDRVYQHVLSKGNAGATCDEVEAELKLRHQTASARVRELAQLGRIVDSTGRRKTRSGRYAVIWVRGDNIPLPEAVSLRDEVKRLRVALKYIADNDPNRFDNAAERSAAFIEQVVNIARAALEVTR
jgi:predicted transcriptional regulator